MNPWPFIAAVYGLAGLGTAAIFIASLVVMRRAEKKVDEL